MGISVMNTAEVLLVGLEPPDIVVRVAHDVDVDLRRNCRGDRHQASAEQCLQLQNAKIAVIKRRE